MTIDQAIVRAVKKASTSHCRYKISAIGFDHRGKILGLTRNNCRFTKPSGSVHAEMALMKKFGKSLSKIWILRTNTTGALLAIHPCKTCKKKAEELGIKIFSVHEMSM